MYQCIWREKDGPYHVFSDAKYSGELVDGARKIKELYPEREVLIISVDKWSVIETIEHYDKNGLNVNDVVLITKRAINHTAGWDNAWTSYMDKYVGRLGIIVEDYGDMGFKIDFFDDSIKFKFPAFILKKIGTIK